MMSIYRELKNGEVDTTELDVHLEKCASCRQELARSLFISEKMHAVPAIEPAPNMHEKLMRALADEQVKFMQKSAPGTVSTPEFLKPYLSDHAQTAQKKHPITAFSTAETGPLPMIRARRKPRHARMNQMTVVALVAACLIVLMMGGLTSLLMLAHNNPTGVNPSNSSASLHRFAEVQQHQYTTQTLYDHVVSAVANGPFIYYTAYGDGANSASWMLIRMDRATGESTPLLSTPVESPLVVMNASDNWLVWLQYDPIQPVHGPGTRDGSVRPHLRTWSLYYLSLTQPAPLASAQASSQKVSAAQIKQTGPLPVMLVKDTFDQYTAPSYATTPVSGTWLLNDTLLVTMIDAHGTSHLLRYALGTAGKAAAPQEIAAASPGHILTSPTADSIGTEIYWGDEWVSAQDGTLHSNIWVQRESDASVRLSGRLLDHPVTVTEQFTTDGLSFDPQIAANTLFMLSTSAISISPQGTVTTTGVPLSSTVMASSTLATPRVDTSIYPTPADASVHGTVFMIPLDGASAGISTMMGNLGQSTALQAGTSYALWQDDTGYKMYDVQRQMDVTVGDTLSDANFLTVNASTTVWTASNSPTPTSTAGPQATLLTFSWPG